MEEGIEEYEEQTFVDDLSQDEKEIIDQAIVPTAENTMLKVDYTNEEKEILGQEKIEETENYVEETNQEIEAGEIYINDFGEVVATQETGEYILQKGSTKI